MGMRYEDFWYNYTLREFWNAVEGYFNKKESENKEQWEQTRLIYAAVINKPVYGYKINPRKPNKLLPFPWDNDSGVPDKDELEELRKDMEETNKKIRDGHKHSS